MDYKEGLLQMQKEHDNIKKHLEKIKNKLDNDLVSKKDLDVLYAIVKDHYSKEEMYMLDVMYPEYARHKNEHADFLEKLSLITEETITKEKIKNWNAYFISHMMRMDRALEMYLEKNGVEEDIVIKELKDPIIWNDNFSVGIKEIDSQHKSLIKYLNHLKLAVEHNDIDKFKDIYFSLTEYTKIHFGFEENIMRFKSYPEFDKHVKQHNVFIAKLNDVGEKLKNNEDVGENFLQIVLDWLINHILKVDMELGDYIVGIHRENQERKKILEQETAKIKNKFGFMNLFKGFFSKKK